MHVLLGTACTAFFVPQAVYLAVYKNFMESIDAIDNGDLLNKVLVFCVPEAVWGVYAELSWCGGCTPRPVSTSLLHPPAQA
jgi:hypothetical protein